MRVSHSLDRIGVDCDDERPVANARLIGPASVAEHLGLKRVFDERVDLDDAPPDHPARRDRARNTVTGPVPACPGLQSATSKIPARRITRRCWLGVRSYAPQDPPSQHDSSRHLKRWSRAQDDGECHC